MTVTHRVKNSKNKTVGFIADGRYYTNKFITEKINLFDNIFITQDGSIKSKNGKLNIISKRKVNNNIYYKDAIKRNRIERDIQNDFKKWNKNNYNSTILYLKGPRQVGKTTELLKFAYSNYEQIIYVNLAEKQVLNNFEEVAMGTMPNIAMIEYCMKLNMEEYVDNRDTILIIDEIQESTIIYNSLRKLRHGLNCDIAITGSYLGATLTKDYFKPAGDVYILELLPLSFSEFCGVYNCRETLQTIDLYGKGTEFNYKKLYKLFETYIQIGGYPSVVTEYVNSKDINNCLSILKNIVEIFTSESAAYFKQPASKSRLIFENVYKEAFKSISYEKKGTSSKDIELITNFVKESTKEHISRAEISDAISWLKYSHIINSCDLYNNGDTNNVLFARRFYFLDCGIANYVSKLTSINRETVRGLLTENFAYTELYRLYQTFEVKGDVPCCSVYNNYELDFMIMDENDVKYGIEIKSSNDNNPNSLLEYLRTHKIDKGFLAGKTRGGRRNGYYSIPIYTVGCRFPYK